MCWTMIYISKILIFEISIKHDWWIILYLDIYFQDNHLDNNISEIQTQKIKEILFNTYR